MLEFVKTMLTINLFWAFAVTLLVATVPSNYLSPVSIYVSSGSADTLNELGGQLETNIQNQLNLPLIDAAALVFYTGNLIVDLLLNFLGGIVLFAKDYKIGLISLLLLFSSEFILFALLGWDTTKAIIAVFLALIVLALSLYTSRNK